MKRLDEKAAKKRIEVTEGRREGRAYIICRTTFPLRGEEAEELVAMQERIAEMATFAREDPSIFLVFFSRTYYARAKFKSLWELKQRLGRWESNRFRAARHDIPDFRSELRFVKLDF